MIKVLALDLDDTLLRSDHSLAPSTYDLLTQWLDRGNRIIIATGRPPRSTGESLPHPLWQAPWACYNGAEIRIGESVIYSDLLSAKDARAIVHMIQSALPDAAVGLEIDDVLYLNRTWDRPTQYQVADLMQIATRPAAKVLFFHDDVRSLNGLFDNIPASAQLMVSEKYRLVQLMSATADKAHAVRHLVTLWGLDMRNVMAFGDDINDLRMIKEAGIGVAVENAVDEVKSVADRITLSNDDGGVEAVLQELLDA